MNGVLHIRIWMAMECTEREGLYTAQAHTCKMDLNGMEWKLEEGIGLKAGWLDVWADRKKGELYDITCKSRAAMCWVKKHTYLVSSHLACLLACLSASCSV